MKKRLLIVAILALSTLFTACGKIPFQKQEIADDSALVYVYVELGSGINDINSYPAYKIGVNGIKMRGDISYGEYRFYRLKPANLTISAYRADIEEQSIKLNIEAGKVYYLQVKSFADGFAKFEISRVDSNTAYEVLKDTTLAGEYESSQAAISELLVEDKSETKSKTDELLNAAKLKKQGLLTDEEFNTLKTEILAK